MGSVGRVAATEMRLVWTEPALRDLTSARDYIAVDSPSAAKRQVEHILKAVGILSRFPETGRPGRIQGTRELVVGRTPFIVSYRVNDGSVELLRVLHGRQRWPSAF